MNLRTTTFSSARWTTASAIIRAVLQLLQTALLARLLTPADFGLMAMAGVAVAVASLFSDLGLSNALMHFSRPDPRTLSTLYWLNLLMACGLALLFAALAWPITQIYAQSELLPVLLWLALYFPLSALGQPFRVLAEKDMRFRPLMQNEMTATVIGFITAISAALAGKGVFSLIAAMLVAASISSVLAWVRLSSGIKPTAYFRPIQITSFVVFGLHATGGRFWNTLRMQADIFIAGIFATPSAVAMYAVTRDQNLKVSNTIINPVITRVGLPAMTQLKDDKTALRSTYLKILRLTASFNFPIYALVALFSDEIVSLLLGSQWQDAGFYMRLFALWALIRSTGNPSGSLLYAAGMAQRAHLWNMLLFFLSIPLFWLSVSYHGLTGLAWMLLSWQIAVFFLAWRFLIFPACGAKLLEYCANIGLPLAATAIASAAALIAVTTLPEQLQLLVGSCIFSGVYIMTSWWINRTWLSTLFELISPFKNILFRVLKICK